LLEYPARPPRSWAGSNRPVFSQGDSGWHPTLSAKGLHAPGPVRIDEHWNPYVRIQRQKIGRFLFPLFLTVDGFSRVAALVPRARLGLEHCGSREGIDLRSRCDSFGRLKPPPFVENVLDCDCTLDESGGARALPIRGRYPPRPPTFALIECCTRIATGNLGRDSPTLARARVK